MAHRGIHRSQQASVESSDAPTYEENLVECLARSLERSGFTGVTVDQARRLGAVGFDGSTDSMVALSWLGDTEKIFDEGMQCPDEAIPVVWDFLDVFPDDLPGLPPKQEIDFFFPLTISWCTREASWSMRDI